MDSITTISLDDFEKRILWSKCEGAIPSPPLTAVATMTNAVRKLFRASEDSEKRTQGFKDVYVARVMVNDVLDEIALPGRLRADLVLNEAHSVDSEYPDVPDISEAVLYPRDAKLHPRDGHPDWTHIRLFIEFKQGGAENDPFDGTNCHLKAWARSRQDVHEKLLAYATNTFQYQHRTGLYSLLINGDEFRAMYWDRSGLIVTEATNYANDPGSLVRFLWAFASLPEEHQGIDPTATLLPEDSEVYTLMDKCARANPALDAPFSEGADVSRWFSESQSEEACKGSAPGSRQDSKQSPQPVFQYVRDGFRNSLVLGWPRYKLLVGKTKREFLVACPTFQSTSMFGRGTRGYIALDVQDHKFVWLKDSWRPFYEGVEPEGNYLEAMASKPDIKLSIPTVVAHGDVLQQTTYPAEYPKDEQMRPSTSSAESASGAATPSKKRAREDDTTERLEDSATPQPFIHYRIVVEEVCLKMGNFKNGRQLVRLIWKCIVTHREAYDHFGLLHRDISTGNLLILPKVHTMPSNGSRLVGWHGLITDWELAKYVPKDDMKQRASQVEPTGTWPFMSVSHIRKPSLPVVVADELESFLHVLIYYSVRYLRHNFRDAVTLFIDGFFGTYEVLGSGKTQCSPDKIAAVTYGSIIVDMKTLRFTTKNGTFDHPLNKLLQHWLSLFVARYGILGQANRAPPVPTEMKAEKTSRTPPPRMREIEAIMGGYAHNADVLEDVLPSLHIVAAANTNDADTISQESKRAKSLDTHKRTEAIFRKFLKNFDWPQYDVVGDQLAKDYNPKTQPVPKAAMTSASDRTSGRAPEPKRAKLDTSVAAASQSGATKSGAPPVPPLRKVRCIRILHRRRAPGALPY